MRRRGDLVVGPWGARMLGRSMPCSIGRGGIRPACDKQEGDGASPAGTWRLRGLYWRADRRAEPFTCLRAMPLGPQQGWAECPDDTAYNAPVRHPHSHPADRMARGDRLYDLCVVTDHNEERVPGLGSAIFVHLWRKPRHPTAGCIAFRHTDLVWILAHWTPNSRLLIRPGHWV